MSKQRLPCLHVEVVLWWFNCWLLCWQAVQWDWGLHWKSDTTRVQRHEPKNASCNIYLQEREPLGLPTKPFGTYETTWRTNMAVLGWSKWDASNNDICWHDTQWLSWEDFKYQFSPKWQISSALWILLQIRLQQDSFMSSMRMQLDQSCSRKQTPPIYQGVQRVPWLDETVWITWCLPYQTWRSFEIVQISRRPTLI